MKKKRIIIAIVIGLLLGMIGGSYIYVSDYYHADTIALNQLTNENLITVEETDDYISFVPEKYDTGIIFYPGAKVKEESYAPLGKQYAKEGILFVVVRMPFRLAILGTNNANKVLDDYDVDRWYMADHSLGGVCAASFVSNHLDQFDGLILMASYSTKDLSDTNLMILSLYGSNDGVLNKESYEKNLTNLNDNSYEEVIIGGNHAQFGSYGEQKNDGIATIDAKTQWEETVQYTKMVMEYGG